MYCIIANEYLVSVQRVPSAIIISINHLGFYVRAKKSSGCVQASIERAVLSDVATLMQSAKFVDLT